MSHAFFSSLDLILGSFKSKVSKLTFSSSLIRTIAIFSVTILSRSSFDLSRSKDRGRGRDLDEPKTSLKYELYSYCHFNNNVDTKNKFTRSLNRFTVLFSFKFLLFQKNFKSLRILVSKILTAYRLYSHPLYILRMCKI